MNLDLIAMLIPALVSSFALDLLQRRTSAVRVAATLPTRQVGRHRRSPGAPAPGVERWSHRSLHLLPVLMAASIRTRVLGVLAVVLVVAVAAELVVRVAASRLPTPWCRRATRPGSSSTTSVVCSPVSRMASSS